MELKVFPVLRILCFWSIFLFIYQNCRGIWPQGVGGGGGSEFDSNLGN